MTLSAMPSADPNLSLISAWDSPEEWRAFSHPITDQLGQTNLWVSDVAFDGIRCAACALNIEEALQTIPGIYSAQVSATTHRGKITWSATQVVPSTWLAALAQAGYHTTPLVNQSLFRSRTQQTRHALWRWLVAGLCMMQVMMYATPAYLAHDISPENTHLLRWASWVLSLPVLLFSAAPFFSSAWRDLVHRHISMDLPVALGIGATFAVSTVGTFEPYGAFGQEVYFDSLTMFIFFLLSGRWLELRLRERTAGTLETLINRIPPAVQKVNGNGELTSVSIQALRMGDVVQVLPGQSFPADGIIIQGQTDIDESLLTGESQAQTGSIGRHVIAGSHNLSGTVRMRVNHLGQDTRFAQIVALIERAALDKPHLAALIDRIAQPFLWGVLLAAIAAAVFNSASGPGPALMAAVAVLVVTCPCALALATPAALLAAAGTSAKNTVLVRRLQGLQALATADMVVFDKTGTLTSELLTLENVLTRTGTTRSEALALAATLAQHSLHPVSRALINTAQQESTPTSPWTCKQPQEIGGCGIQASICLPDSLNLVTARLGSHAFACPEFQTPPTTGLMQVFLSDAQGWLATFAFSEKLRTDALQSINKLRERGLEIRILSGDVEQVVQKTAESLGITHWQAKCSPQDKLQALQTWSAQGRRVVMVGDGLNDGPVLAHAHSSFVLGHALPLAQSKADFVVLSSGISAVYTTMQLAQKTQRIISQNISWAIAYNIVCIPLAMAGWLPAWAASIGMATSSLLVITNALRLTMPHSIWTSSTS